MRTSLTANGRPVKVSPGTTAARWMRTPIPATTSGTTTKVSTSRTRRAPISTGAVRTCSRMWSNIFPTRRTSPPVHWWWERRPTTTISHSRMIEVFSQSPIIGMFLPVSVSHILAVSISVSSVTVLPVLEVVVLMITTATLSIVSSFGRSGARSVSALSFLSALSRRGSISISILLPASGRTLLAAIFGRPSTGMIMVPITITIATLPIPLGVSVPISISGAVMALFITTGRHRA
mmetsp:Transcript_17557/g.38366  ORF Transcript_17557/g.38366 Transcript_17557/m.38366 type:complete len:235 (+) Transcript_17557:135-839(+)